MLPPLLPVIGAIRNELLLCTMARQTSGAIGTANAFSGEEMKPEKCPA
jgi:hypothetical protein